VLYSSSETKGVILVQISSEEPQERDIIILIDICITFLSDCRNDHSFIIYMLSFINQKYIIHKNGVLFIIFPLRKMESKHKIIIIISSNPPFFAFRAINRRQSESNFAVFPMYVEGTTEKISRRLIQLNMYLARNFCCLFLIIFYRLPPFKKPHYYFFVCAVDIARRLNFPFSDPATLKVSERELVQCAK